MITAQGTNRVDDPVHLPQFHAVHGLVQGIEVFLDLFVVHFVDLVVGLVQKSQNGVTIPEVQRVFLYLLFQLLDIWIHGHTPPKVCGMLAWNPQNCKPFLCQLFIKGSKFLDSIPGNILLSAVTITVERCTAPRFFLEVIECTITFSEGGFTLNLTYKTKPQEEIS